MEPTITPTTYTVTCLPPDGLGAENWDIEVQYTGGFRWGKPTPPERHWAVRLRGHWCLSDEGEWDRESIPGEREDEWLADHRFTLETALNLAKQAAPHVTVNSQTPAEYLAWRANRAA
jgi:hypothetical protein